jgi:hypothetical protein
MIGMIEMKIKKKKCGKGVRKDVNVVKSEGEKKI